MDTGLWCASSVESLDGKYNSRAVRLRLHASFLKTAAVLPCDILIARKHAYGCWFYGPLHTKCSDSNGHCVLTPCTHIVLEFANAAGEEGNCLTTIVRKYGKVSFLGRGSTIDEQRDRSRYALLLNSPATISASILRDDSLGSKWSTACLEVDS